MTIVYNHTSNVVILTKQVIYIYTPVHSSYKNYHWNNFHW